MGLELVKQLSAEDYEVTLIDTKQEVLEAAINNYDVMAVRGNCATVEVLREAGINEAQILIAAIKGDETNLLCCMTAYKLNPKLHTIARIRNPEYREQVYDMQDLFGLSLIVNPERSAAREIERLLRYPGFLRRDSFAKDRVEIVEIQLKKGSPLCGVSLINMQKVTGTRVLVCAVLRKGEAIMPGGDFIFEEGDRIFVTAPTSNLTLLLKNIGIINRKVRKIMICGGGKIAWHLAQRLEKSSIRATIVEQNEETCYALAEAFPYINVVQGDATNMSMLESAGVRDVDALISLTSLDEMNLMISLYANNMEIPQIITKIAHLENNLMLHELPIGSVLDPKVLASNNIVRYVRAMKNQNASAVSIHTFAEGKVEPEEFLVDKHAKYCGVPFRKLPLKKGILIAGINRGSEIIIPDGNAYYQEHDGIVIVTNERTKIERLNDIFEG